MESFNLSDYKEEREIAYRLMSAHNQLHGFPCRTMMTEFAVEAIEGIPGIDSCGMCVPGNTGPLGNVKKEQCERCILFSNNLHEISMGDCTLTNKEGIQVVPLEVSGRIYGFLLLVIKDAEKYNLYEAFLQSFVTSVAISLENRWQKERLLAVNRELSKHRDNLEDLVKQRTDGLAASNTLLQKEISERRQAEQALQESEERYRTLVENSPDVIFRISAEDATISSLNPAFERITGWSVNQFIGAKFISILYPEDVSLADSKFQHTLNGEATSAFTLRILSKSKEEIVGEFIAVPELEDVKITSVIGFGRDITKRLRAEEALRESEERFRSLSENAPDIIYTLDEDGAFNYINPAFKEILGYERDEVIGKYFIDFARDEDAKEYVRLFKRARDGKETIENFTGILLHKDGSHRLFSASGSPNLDNKGELKGIVGLLKDITEHRKLEVQFHQAQKMEAIGTLAGGIAHDFNNLLMGIQGNVSIMLLDVERNHPHYDNLRSIEQSIRSGASLTKQLLGFARVGKYEVRTTDLNELIRKTSYMFGRTKKQIRIHTEYQQQIWAVNVDQGQIEQVLLNLYVNAWQAMPGGGELYLKSENIELDSEYVKSFQLKQGKYVKVSIGDTGIGMDEKTKQRIFDPFFTTKEMGRGTGLGLASVYGIIQNHSGIIEVETEKGVGTTFHIYLPASEERTAEEGTEFHEKLFIGEETILLVDDEDPVIDVGREMLRKIGYRVLTAKSGKEALDICENQKGEIDVVILDMIMPDMGGIETHEKLKVIDQEIGVLFSSGYRVDQQETGITEQDTFPFIQKPFDIRLLSQRIREILEQKHERVRRKSNKDS